MSWNTFLLQQSNDANNPLDIILGNQAPIMWMPLMVYTQTLEYHSIENMERGGRGRLISLSWVCMYQF